MCIERSKRECMSKWEANEIVCYGSFQQHKTNIARIAQNQHSFQQQALHNTVFNLKWKFMALNKNKEEAAYTSNHKFSTMHLLFLFLLDQELPLPKYRERNNHPWRAWIRFSPTKMLVRHFIAFSHIHNCGTTV
jgi:hypothetical protein